MITVAWHSALVSCVPHRCADIWRNATVNRQELVVVVLAGGVGQAVWKTLEV